ncbi:hypothetical protein ACP0I9_12100 [Pseudomonas aeruginosa]|uniref:hypothetical protein n=1 Tax=Pseudomonas aeruginosa TaxID=287 RepID=UPI001BD2EC03|nr:hypothetical protein [Pseudomonas aeruginosa]MBS9732737.1 hypothetical protein [Pseudomonas aeruginosa]
MSIDWGKANDRAVAALIAKKNNIHYPGFEFVSGYHRTGCMIRATSADDGRPLSALEDVWEIVERPATWSGQGLPPVGTVCEWHESDGWAYTESKVVAYTDDGLFVCMQKPGRRPEVLRIDNCEFRPLRTPEQIAAEEREKAIEEMCFAEETLTVKQAKALYDAGYRRQESST